MAIIYVSFGTGPSPGIASPFDYMWVNAGLFQVFKESVEPSQDMLIPDKRNVEQWRACRRKSCISLTPLCPPKQPQQLEAVSSQGIGDAMCFGVKRPYLEILFPEGAQRSSNQST